MSADQGPSALRTGIERRSALPIAFIQGLPRWTVPVALAVLLIMGMVLQGWPAGLPLLVVAAVIGWLGYLSWPVLDASGRVMRLVALAILLVFAAGHLSGQF